MPDRAKLLWGPLKWSEYFSHTTKNTLLLRIEFNVLDLDCRSGLLQRGNATFIKKYCLPKLWHPSKFAITKPFLKVFENVQRFHRTNRPMNKAMYWGSIPGSKIFGD